MERLDLQNLEQKFPFQKETVSLILRSFRLEFPDSNLPESAKRWPKYIMQYVCEVSQIINVENDRERQELERAEELHNNRRQELLLTMAALLLDFKKKKNPAAEQLNAVENLEKYDKKQRRNFFRRLSSRLFRKFNGPLYRHLRNIRKQKRQVADKTAISAYNGRITKTGTDYTSYGMQQYFNCFVQD